MSIDIELGAQRIHPIDIIVGAVEATAGFEFRWPVNVERFDRGWEFVAVDQGIADLHGLQR